MQRNLLCKEIVLQFLQNFGSSQKGGFQKGGFGGCSPGTKTGMRVRSPKPPFWKPPFYLPMTLLGLFVVRKRGVSKRVVSADVPPERKPERGYVRQNHPFTKPPFYLPVKIDCAKTFFGKCIFCKNFGRAGKQEAGRKSLPKLFVKTRAALNPKDPTELKLVRRPHPSYFATSVVFTIRTVFPFLLERQALLSTLHSVLLRPWRFFSRRSEFALRTIPVRKGPLERGQT